MSFIAAPPPTAPAPPVADGIAADGFWPALSVAKFRDTMRVGQTVSDGRAREALIAGIVAADVALKDWRTAHVAAGRATLTETSADTIAGENRAVAIWRRAVHSFAAADLADTHGDISATEAGRDRIEVRATSADELRRNATAAIRDLLGRSRSKVRLV